MGENLAKKNSLLHVKFEDIEHHGNAMETIRNFENEIEGYTDTLFGRTKSPVEAGVSSLYEIAVAYYARAKEI